MSGEAPKFVLDTGLHSLCKALRMLGFDSLYRGNLASAAAIRQAIEEQRIWIRDDADLPNLQYGIRYFVVQSIGVPGQLKELDEQYSLRTCAHPFSLCLICNQGLSEIPRSEASDRVPVRVFATFERFYSCPECGRVYWPGSHFERMKKVLESWGW